MRRCPFMLIVIMLAGGCASHRAAPQVAMLPSDPVTEPAQPLFDEARVAAALVFDPPAIANQPIPDLSRDDRDVWAFIGYDQGVTTFFVIAQNDRQIIDATGAQRQASSATVGFRSR